MIEKKNEKKIEPTVSDKLWDEIKNAPIDMFALPNQCVKQHVQRIKISPTEVHLKLKSTAVVASLEAALGLKYQVEVCEGYVIVRKAPTPFGAPKPEPLEE